jgi:AcrR family transcriptional regulator
MDRTGRRALESPDPPLAPVPMSPIPRRRNPSQARSRQTVERLLRAAGQLLDQHGYGALTTKAIAGEARVSIGSFYQFFANKDAVVLALIEAAGEGIRAVVADAGSPERLAREGITEAWVERILEGFRNLSQQSPGFSGVWGGQFPAPALRDRAGALRGETVAAIEAVLLQAFPQLEAGKTRPVVVVVVETARSVLHTLRRAAADPEVDAPLIRDELPGMLASYLRGRLDLGGRGSAIDDGCGSDPERVQR